MRLPPDGAPFVPPQPICPANQNGHIPDLGAVPFELGIDSGTRRPTDIGGEFRVYDKGGKTTDFVETDIMQLPPDSPLVKRIEELAYTKTESGSRGRPLDSTESPFVNQVRVRFCKRVAKCQGVIEGECWALGKSAVREVIEEALKKVDGPQP